MSDMNETFEISNPTVCNNCQVSFPKDCSKCTFNYFRKLEKEMIDIDPEIASILNERKDESCNPH